jgi:4,5-DOPA dioxygenase extradiol
VVQLSINQFKDFGYHLGLGARLAPLRDRGVLIVASGNIVHNLAGMEPELGDRAFDWAQRFDNQARMQLVDDPAEVLRLREHPDYSAAVPTPDHFLPLLYFAGLAAADGAKAEVLVDGCTYGSLSMTSYTLGVDLAPTPNDDRDAASPAEGVPVDETNI